MMKPFVDLNCFTLTHDGDVGSYFLIGRSVKCYALIPLKSFTVIPLYKVEHRCVDLPSNRVQLI